MEDIRNGICYVIWGLENQYVPDCTTPFKVMGYNYTAYDRQIEEFTAYNKGMCHQHLCGTAFARTEGKACDHIGIVLWQGRNT